LKKLFIYKFIWLAIAITAVSGCINNQKKLNRRISFSRRDKIPYGGYYAYENLKYIFPEAEIVIENHSDIKSQNEYWQKVNENKGHTAVIVITKDMEPSDEELNIIFDLINQGDQVFISALSFSRKFLDSFKLKDFNSRSFVFKDTLKTSIMSPIDYTENTYTYPGYGSNNYFTSMDTGYVRVLGKNSDGKANFININYKNGANLYLHLEPFAFSNFFLLHKDNKSYYDYALSYLPVHTKMVTWSEGIRRSRKSALDFILGIEPFVWAFWLLLLLFLILYLFESKRKQQMIPVIAPLRNSSLDFVKTIGRLYYQRRDNLNLANKMSAHFLGHVRSKYNLQTANLDKDFAERLSYKSGYDKELTKDIVDHIKVIQQQQSLSDEGLLDFNNKMEEFYKHK